MKKIFAILLAVAMMATLSVSTFAKTVGEGTLDPIDVKAEYKDNVTTPEKISVDVSWGAMSFTYIVNGENKWNAEDHEYSTENASTDWQPSGNEITVVNHSNVGVTASFGFTVANGYGGENGINGTFDKSSVGLKSAVGVGTDTESLKTLTGSAKLTLSGNLKSGTASNTKVGTITVTIAKTPTTEQ